MDGKTTESPELNQLVETLGFSQVQRDLVNQSKVSGDSKINRIRTISEIYLGNRLEDVARDLAASSERFSKAANWLTGALAFLALVQVVVQVLALLN